MRDFYRAEYENGTLGPFAAESWEAALNWARTSPRRIPLNSFGDLISLTWVFAIDGEAHE